MIAEAHSQIIKCLKYNNRVHLRFASLHLCTLFKLILKAFLNGQNAPCYIRLDLAFVHRACPKIITDSMISLRGDGYLPTWLHDSPLIDYKKIHRENLAGVPIKIIESTLCTSTVFQVLETVYGCGLEVFR